jgi:uncharacterized membrane protein
MTDMATEITTAKQAFPNDALKRIAETIEEVERETNAEIRISIREDRDENEAELSVRDIALKEFASLKMHTTAERTGVLLLIIFDERKFYIYGDEGIHRRSDPETWTDVAETLMAHFKESKFEQGVHAALRTLKAHVSVHAPKRDDNPDELPNEVTIR